MTSSSKTTSTGRVLEVTETEDGYPVVKLDNGPVRVIHMVTSADTLPALLEDDFRQIRDHLMTRMSSRFRVKGG